MDFIGSAIGGAVSGLFGGGGGGGGSTDSIGKMTAAFDQAIAKSTEITAITTEKKVELDAAKQRPNG